MIRKQKASNFDMIIVGAGPAGVAAAIKSSRMGWKTLVLDRGSVGGMANLGPYIENYPGFDVPISNIKFSERLRRQAEKFGAEVRELVEVANIEIDQKPIRVISSIGVFTAKVVVLATGTRRRHLNIPGERAFEAKGVSYVATCASSILGKKVAVVGGGNSAVTEALFLDNLAREVFLIHRRERLRAEKALQKEILNHSMVNLIWNSVVTEIHGTEASGVKKLSLKNVKTGEKRTLRVKGVFIAIGTTPNNDLANKIGVELTAEGLIKVDSHQRTNIPRIYAAGDITPGQGKIAVAVGEGATAAISAFLDMRGGDWYREESENIDKIGYTDG